MYIYICVYIYAYIYIYIYIYICRYTIMYVDIHDQVHLVGHDCLIPTVGISPRSVDHIFMKLLRYTGIPCSCCLYSFFVGEAANKQYGFVLLETLEIHK